MTRVCRSSPRKYIKVRVMILPLCVPASSSLWRGDVDTTNSSTLTEGPQSPCKYLKPKVLGSSQGRGATLMVLGGWARLDSQGQHQHWGQKQTEPYYRSQDSPGGDTPTSRYQWNPLRYFSRKKLLTPAKDECEYLNRTKWMVTGREWLLCISMIKISSSIKFC